MKVPCGGFKIDNDTLKLKNDGTLYAAGGGGSIPKPLTYDYMPEGYPSKTIKNTTILDETLTLKEADAGLYYVLVQKAVEFSVGTTYKVIFNGDEYECVAKEFEGSTVLGNLSLIDSENQDFDTGEPFFIYPNPGMNMCYIYANTSNCAISVSGDTTVYNVISDDFLPKYTKLISLPMPTASVKEYCDAIDEQHNNGAMVQWGQLLIFGDSLNTETKTVTFYTVNSEMSVSWSEDSSDLSQCYLNRMAVKEVIPTEQYIASSTGKKFKITVDDSGTISATEVTS